MDLKRRQFVSSGLVTGIGLAVAGTLGPRAAAQTATEPIATAPSAPSLRVQIALFDGFQAIDGLGPFDVFTLAGNLSGGALETALVNVDGASDVVSLGDLHLKLTAAFDPSADVLLIPGAPALWRAGGTPARLAETMQEWRGAGKLLATVCTGAVFAARAGLLAGRHANTHKAAQEVIVQEGAVLVPARVVDDGDLISSAGATSGIDLALSVVERYFGSQLAFQIEQILEYERRGVVWRA